MRRNTLNIWLNCDCTQYLVFYSLLLPGQGRRGRVRSEYEDLDDEMTNTWPSKSGGQRDMLLWLLVLVDG